MLSSSYSMLCDTMFASMWQRVATRDDSVTLPFGSDSSMIQLVHYHATLPCLEETQRVADQPERRPPRNPAANPPPPGRPNSKTSSACS
mmetsp:Transcript_12170/g.33499  ORF Transcript_12170/g.33499 Transcript_12170/m.33499 type:complete len:89 (-) Transcript_12170:623-889(-)